MANLTIGLSSSRAAPMGSWSEDEAFELATMVRDDLLEQARIAHYAGRYDESDELCGEAYEAETRWFDLNGYDLPSPPPGLDYEWEEVQ